jgi:hypothetical protein
MGNAYHKARGPVTLPADSPVAADTSTSEIIEALWPLVTRRMIDRAAAAVDLVEELLRAHGPIHRRDHELRAGDLILNDDRDIIPRVGRATSLGISLYLGNRRIAAFSMLDAGSPPEIGGFADASLVDTVLRRREPFRGMLESSGRRVLVACRPIFGAQGSEEYGALGMIEAFQDLHSFYEVAAAALRDGMGLTGLSQRQDQSDRISAVMEFIDDVSRRLQLLALNGNIIAAQAGDHGRAFRVVCRELSSLADQSKDAVSEVRKLAEEIAPPADPDSPEGALGGS